MVTRLAVLASGSGTSLQNLIDRIEQGALDATIGVVISDHKDAKALDRARRAGIPAEAILHRSQTVESFSQKIFEACRQHEVKLVVLAGFMRLLVIPDDYSHAVINIHPALIPAFCGKGYYGERVHQAAIERGVKITGCTVHFCDNHYDHGPIISQRTVAVDDDDTPQSLAARVQAAEREALPEAIALWGAGRLSVEGRRVRIKEEK